MKIIGSSVVPRYHTGLYSLDHAFHVHKVGFPASGLIELSGVAHVGKSTCAYSLAAILAKIKETDISLFDNEGFDEEFFADVVKPLGFDGTVYVIEQETDEESLREMLTNTMSKDQIPAEMQKNKKVKLQEKPALIGIVDSAGSISPIGEISGNIGDANMGRRAFILGQFVRRLGHRNQGKHDVVVFLTNHIQVSLGGYGGISTPGGKATTYGPAIKIFIRQVGQYPPAPKKSEGKEDTPMGRVLEGRVDKNRWGGKGRTFKVCVLSGQGIHPGLTALYDCADLGLVQRGQVLKVNDESIGYLKSFYEAAMDGNEDKFDVFHELLQEHLENDNSRN